MIKAKDLLAQIHDVVDNIPTVYEQGSGWGAWNGRAFRLDCIIFIKCLVYWHWYYPDKNAAHGGAQYDPRTDYTEDGLLQHCTGVSGSGFLAADPGELLYMSGHCGFKIDEFTRDGKTYNVAECAVAGAWGSPRKCIYSYVDDQGRSYSHKGGTYRCNWTRHGKLDAVDYSGDEKPSRPWSIDDIAVSFIRGSLPDGTAVPNGLENRISLLSQYGYDVDEVREAQEIVNQVYARHDRDKECADDALRFISGEAGDGEKARKQWLIKRYGTDDRYREIQDKVNAYLS